MPYYAVHKGHKTGIYTNWNECKENVTKFKNPVFKKFNSKEEAKYFQTGMYTPNVENSGINVIPGNTTGNTIITNNYYGGGSGGGESETGEGNPTMNDLGFEGLVTNYALATK